MPARLLAIQKYTPPKDTETLASTVFSMSLSVTVETDVSLEIMRTTGCGDPVARQSSNAVLLEFAKLLTLDANE